MTSPTAQEMLDKYLTAEQAILTGKEMRWNDRLLRYEDLNMIQEGRAYWQGQVNAQAMQAAGKSSIRTATANFSRCGSEG